MPNRFRSLFVQFTLLIIVFFSAVFLVFGVSIWLAGKGENQRDALVLGETILDSLVQLIQLQGFDAPWLQSYIVPLGAGPGILNLYVCTTEGKLVANAQLSTSSNPCIAGLPGKGQAAGRRKIAQDEDVLRIIEPIHSNVFQEDPDGVAVIELDLRKQIQVTLWEHQKFLFLLFTMIIILVGVLYFTIHFLLIRRLQILQSAAFRIAQGDFSVRLSSTSFDELDSLADAFNRMVNYLNKTVVSKNYFNSVLRSAGDILLVLDQAGRVRLVNQAASDILGYGEKDLCQLNVRDLCADPAPAMFPDSVDSEKISSLAGVEMEFVKDSGERVPVLLSLNTIIGEGGRVAGYVCSAKDIRERKRAEDEIRSMNDHLMTVNNALRSTQAQLVQAAKLASLGEMATGITHELNQPLLIINLNAQMGLKLLQQEKSQEVKDHLTTIIEQVKRAGTIVNHLKIFGRKSETVSMKPEDINGIVRDSFILFQEQFRLKGIKVDLELAENLPPILCNRIQVEQVMTNLLTNARDAMEDSVEKTITVRTSQEGERVLVQVSDTGEGIPHDIRHMIFDPFFTTKEIGRGTGLGLAISYGIMQQHNGSLECVSESGKGAVFSLAFPVQQTG